MLCFSDKQYMLIKYEDVQGRPRILYDIMKNINDKYLIPYSGSCKTYFLDENMEWRKIKRVIPHLLDRQLPKEMYVSTEGHHELYIRHDSSYAAQNFSVGDELPFHKYSLKGEPGLNNQTVLLDDYNRHYSFTMPVELGYLDGVVLGGFLYLNGAIDGNLGKMHLDFDCNYSSYRKNKIVNAIREIMYRYKIYDKEEAHYTELFTEETRLGRIYVDFRSHRIAEMILAYHNVDTRMSKTKEFTPISNILKIPEYIQIYEELAKDKELNPNGHEANDPIIRRILIEAYNRYMLNKQNEANESTENVKDSYIEYINPNVLMESIEFRKGILDGFLDTSPLTLHVYCITEQLAHTLAMIASSVHYRAFIEPKEINVGNRPMTIYSVLIDKLYDLDERNLGYKILLSTEAENNVNTCYSIIPEDDNVKTITLPNGIVCKL